MPINPGIPVGPMIPVDPNLNYEDADYSTTLQVGVPATGTISADEDMYELGFGPNSPVRGYTVALKADVTYTICATVRTADGKPANLAPTVALLTADKDYCLEKNTWSSSSSSEVYSKVTYTPEADGNYCVLGANSFYGSSIESAYYSISVYETPYCTAENAEYTAIGLGENTGTLSFASDAYYYSSGNGYYNAKFLKVSLKAGETYSINYQLSKKAKEAYGLAPYIAIDGGYPYSNGTDFADSCSVLTITITPEADGDCKIAIWNGWGGPIPCEYDYKLTIRQLDKASGLASLDCSTEYTVGSVISGSLNADDKQVYCSSDYYGYAEGYSVNVPNDGNKYAFFFKEESDNTFKKASVVLFKKAFSDAPFAHTEGFPDPIFLSCVVSAGQYKLALMSDQMNSADYKFAIRKVATQPSDIDFSRKLTVGKSQSEYADPFSTQPLSTSESFFAYYSGYSVELEKGVTYKFSTTAKDVSSELALFAEGDMDTPLKNVTSDYDDETKTYSAEFYCTPDETGTYNLVAQFGNGYFGTPVKYMVEEVSSLADLLNNATELTGTHTAQLDFSKDAQLFDSGLEGVMLLGKAYKMSLAEGELLMEQWSDRISYLLFNKDAEGNFQMSNLNGDSEYFSYSADADTVLYFVLAVQPNVSNEKVSMAGFVCKPIVQLLDGAVEVAQLPYTASGVFNAFDKDAQMCISGGVCGVYKLNIAKGEYVNYSFEATAGGAWFVYSKVDGEYVFVHDFYAGARLGGFDKDTTLYVANAINGTMSPYNVTINNGNAITLTELFNGATEIGSVPFYAEGNSAQNSTLTNIREYIALPNTWDDDSDRFTYANAYKLSLEAGESVRIDYSSTEDAFMLLYSKKAGGTYDLIDSKDGGNNDSFYGDGEYYDFTALTDTTIYIYVAPYDQLTQTNWAFNVMMDKKVPSADLTLADLLDSATEVDMNALRTDGYAMFNGGATELYNTSNYIPWANNLTTTAVAYKFLVPAGANINLYNLKNDVYEGFYFRKTANGYKYCDRSEKLMRDSAGDTLYVVSLSNSHSTYAYVHVLEFYENVTELKYPDFMFEQEPTKEDVMVALFENNPYFVNCFGDTIVVSMDEIGRNGKIKGCNINMAGHELTYYVSYNRSYLNDCYNINVSEIKARFGVSFTLAVSATGNGTVNSNVSGKYLKDTEVAISAVPAEHYHFVKWSNGSLKATDTIVVVSDTALVAEFAIDTYNVELSAENGTVTGAGEYGYGSAAAIAATPAEGFHFVQWSNGSLKANDTITVVSDTALIAEFAAHQYGAWDTTLVATCTASGLRTHACACGEVEVDTIPAHGHTIVVDQAVAATYTSTGLTEGKHCSVCDSVFVAQQVIPMLLNEVTNVEVSTLPAKTTYKQGEELDVTGGVVTVTYSDESSQTFDIIAEMVSGFDSQKLGTQQLIVTVSGVSQTATFEVTVEKADAIDEELSAAVVIYAHHNTIVVENAEADIYVYDATGRMIAREAVTSNRMEMQMTEQGIYVVRTGDKTQRVFVK